MTGLRVTTRGTTFSNTLLVRPHKPTRHVLDSHDGTVYCTPKRVSFLCRGMLKGGPSCRNIPNRLSWSSPQQGALVTWQHLQHRTPDCEHTTAAAANPTSTNFCTAAIAHLTHIAADLGSCWYAHRMFGSMTVSMECTAFLTATRRRPTTHQLHCW